MVKKKVNNRFLFAIMVMVGVMGVGCSQNQSDNLIRSSSKESVETVEEQSEIYITNESNTIHTELEQENPEKEIKGSIFETESTVAEQSRESNTAETSSITQDDDIISYGTVKSIDGFQMVDGIEVPIQVAFHVVNIQRGETAYNILASSDPGILKPEVGMEYIIVTMNVAYDEGTPDTLYMMENYASLDSAKMFFYLSNGDSNAEQMTKYLDDNVYSLSIEKGKSAQGSVAFLHNAGSNEPLCFVGYGKTIKFDIN